jgi:uncharacterized protein with HEPN domain
VLFRFYVTDIEDTSEFEEKFKGACEYLREFKEELENRKRFLNGVEERVANRVEIEKELVMSLKKLDNDRVLIFRIIEAVESIHKIIENITYEEFKGNDLLVSAVILKFEIVGEIAKNISEELRNKDNGINWKDLIEYRNYLIDNYFDIDLITLWKKSNNALVKLKEKLLILKENEKK